MKCAIDDTIAYIKRMAQNMAGFDPDYAVLAFMLDLKIPVNLYGFEYLKLAILMRYKNPTMDLTNEIYWKIAEVHGDIGGDVISSSIRRVIRSSFSPDNITKWKLYLPASSLTMGYPPTNAETIAGLARILEFWQGCSEAYLRQASKEVVSCGRK